MANMFGVIASGQLVQTDFQLVGEKQFLIRIANADSMNHMVVFLTGVSPFPDGLGGLVYFSLPDPVQPPAWHLLGYISNEKPSAIFKVAGLKASQQKFNPDGTPFMFGLGAISVEAQLGIAVESLANIQQQCPSGPKNSDLLQPSAAIQFAQNILQNLMNYTMSFAVTQSQMTGNSNETYVPLSSLQSWYSNFERRLMQSPNFLRDF